MKKTRLTVREDYATSSSSVLLGHNLNTVSFNIDYIAMRDPILAVNIMRAYRMTKDIHTKPLISGDNPEVAMALSQLERSMGLEDEV